MTSSRSAYTTVLWMVVALLILSSCKRNRAIRGDIPGRSPSYITAELENALLDFEWFGAKIASEVRMKDEKHSFKTVLKMRKDSVIWLSISPALGIEVARMVITPDSVKFVDKWNDQYFIGDYSIMQDRLDLYFDFAILQDMIVGNPLLYDNTEKFKSTKEEGLYVLTSKNKPRVRRAAGIRYTKKSVEEMADTLAIELDERDVDRAMRRTDDEELILKRYWVDSDSWKTMRTIITDLGTLRSIEGNYLEFIEVDGQKVPERLSYVVIDNEERSSFEMEYSRIRIDQPYTFPFTVPDKFVRME